MPEAPGCSEGDYDLVALQEMLSGGLQGIVRIFEEFLHAVSGEGCVVMEGTVSFVSGSDHDTVVFRESPALNQPFDTVEYGHRVI